MDTHPPRDLRADFLMHLHNRYEAGGRHLRFEGQTPADFAAWQEGARAALLSALGLEGPIAPPDLERIPTDTAGDPAFAGLRLERLYYRTRPDLTATAWLVMPEGLGRPAAAVLCPPGHGGGMNQVVFEDSIYRRYPLELARRGFVALVPEHIGFGERGNLPDVGEGTHDLYYHSVLMLGGTAMGYMIWDLRRALDVLAGLPEVDPRRLACYGLSLGGETTMLLCAVDTRVGVVCTSGFLTSYRSTFLRERHCGCGYVPGLALLLEHADIAALIAPRPLLVETGRGDPSFLVKDAEAAVEELRPVYRLLGAEERLTLHVHDGAHEISGEQAFPWLRKYL